ncbi:MAG: hypothetical protein HC767_00165 [Akkermansiaceae bacterium]|nr:hypothetical protein [Akkermansiaceae bacterium]
MFTMLMCEPANACGGMQIAQVHHEDVEQTQRDAAAHFLELRRGMDGVRAAAAQVQLHVNVYVCDVYAAA